ncbi:MAG: fibronectin type III domain-containing protein [Paludibacteraceae bacterium]|nr:fibronectin type III domain-containing protein [Paludibacteraceae bacterium]
MKKIVFTLLSAAFALSTFAQLSVPFTFTQDNFNDESVVIANVNEGNEDTPAKWSDGIYFGGTKTLVDGFNWDDKYVIIAIDGLADSLSFETTTQWSATTVSNRFWYICESETQDFGDPIWTSNSQSNNKKIELANSTKYIKLCYTGNLNGTIKNISASKYAPKATDATDVSYSSFTANWEAARGDGLTYTLEVKEGDEVVKTVESLTDTSYSVEDLKENTTYTYSIFVVVTDGVIMSDYSNSIEVTTLEKPVITPVQDEYTLLSDTGIEGYTSVLLTATNVTEVTATVEGDSEFYFKDAEGNHVTTKTLPLEAAGPTEFELFSYFDSEGIYNATITLSATDADDAVVTVLANVSKPTDVPEQKLSSKVKSFNNGVLEFNEDYTSIVVSTLIGKTVAKGQGHAIALAKGQAYIVETVDFEGKKSTVKVQ